ncbi:hypothetical protein BHM03_00029777 [Ensete ventricosum]|nr:hypothetical protein BHM03_00029777 [Ensete ventricosum]
MATSASAQMALHDDHGSQQIQNPGLHDDFFDQMLSGLPSAWPELGNPKSPWDASAAQKLFRIDLTGKPPDESQLEAATEGLRYASYDEATMLASRLPQSQGSGGSSPTGEAMMLQLNNRHILPAVVPLQAAVGGGVGELGLLPLPLTLGSGGAADPRIIVETSRDEMDGPYKSPDQNLNRPTSSQNHGGAAAPAGVGQGPAASASSGGGAPQQKQKVRARRGQATDPHSIAERVCVALIFPVPSFFLVGWVRACLRRERIAERMKALQELVPNANKGAGARAGADGAAAGNNDSLTATEHRVAKMMEEDMGSAMQYLQGKGLCLMPISLASAISSAACRPSAGGLVSAPPPPATSAAAAAESPSSSPSASALTVQSAAAADTTAPKR